MRVLMLGNSYTYFFDMPKILQALFDENGVDAQVDSVTAGGRRLVQNTDEGDALHAEVVAKCKESAYDVLILQEQSHTPMSHYREFLRGVCGCVELVKPARTVMYATWGRREGCDLLDEFGWTNQSMTEGLAAAYDAAARKIGGECAHVGKCFFEIRRAYPGIELYDPDHSHPSYVGSCVAALAIYKKLMGGMPATTACLDVDAEDLTRVCSVVDSVN
ncbi:MAG: hypothetical protein E7581_02330 [Ruminococcaceae bacterium]|nr:hypothetical protein [Oscillospiraceae bacterium]